MVLKVSLHKLRPTKFLGCIQLRLGVLIFSALTLLFGGIVAAFAFMQVASLKKHPLQMLDNIALALHAIFWTLLFLVSIFGLFATFRRNDRFLTIYWIILLNMFVASFILGVFVFVVIFTPNTRTVVNKCLGGLKDEFTLAGCRNGLAMFAGVAVSIYVVIWLILAYLGLVVWAHAHEIKRGLDYDENAPVKPEQISNPAPLTMYNSFGAPGHNNGYAFSSVDNSYGKGNGRSPNSSILGAGVGAGAQGGHARNFSGDRLQIV